MFTTSVTNWYAVSIAAIAASLLVYCIGAAIYALFVAHAKYLALKHVVYPLLPSWIRRWTIITRFQGSLVVGYVALNGFCMGLGIKSSSDLLIRSGLMASINMIPLFLGGRTSVLANFVGISVHTYYLAHHWIGRVVIVQTILHVILVIIKRKPWTFDSFQLSGISSASALALMFLSSLWLIRKMAYEFFLKTHFILAMISIWALLKHLIPSGLDVSIFPIVTLSLWGINTVFRLIRILYYNCGNGSGSAIITPYYGSAGNKQVTSIRVDVFLKRPMKVRRPGQYVYLFLSNMGIRRRFQAHPYVVTWWDNSMSARKLSFLIQPQGGISSALASSALLGTRGIGSVIIDGPYGKDHHLEEYENVILIARGIGIAGILPYVRHMTYRRLSEDEEHDAYRRGMITRKLSVFWVLDDNNEEEMVYEWLSKLKEKDSKKILLTFLCLYPHQRTRPPPIPSDTHWKFVYQKRKPVDIIQTLMTKTIQRSAGRTKVAVCGRPDFSLSIRTAVLEAMNQYPGIEFAELEFRPQGVRKACPGAKSIFTEEFELDRVRHLVKYNKDPVLKRLQGEERLFGKRFKTATKLETVNEADEVSDLDTASFDEKKQSTEETLLNENVLSNKHETGTESWVRSPFGLTTKLPKLKEADPSSNRDTQSERAHEKEIL